MSRHRNDLVVFLAVAFGLSWLLATPLWISGAPLGSPTQNITAVALMFTPALGVLAVFLLARRDGVSFREWARRTGLGLGPNRLRTIMLFVAAWIGTPLLVGVAIALSAAAGLLVLDLDDFSLLRQQLEAASQGQPLPAPPAAVAAAQVALAFLVAPIVNCVGAFGEEWGWRGWLLPRLMPMGTWRAVLVSGIIWGAWHAPVTLRGYNYPELGWLAAPLWTGFCVIYGALLGWLRLRTDSVWPAVVGHGALNAAAGLVAVFGDASAPPTR
ncbi:CPBP family intramembrane glutamic endopeptidase [Thermocatellispora tengchongensis]|uniref:CPBP family intramembrane glutamic endopeptidase n=1 Tax=Thermocatellispora tengchongensis TaxID=1073253 RepID=UPI0036424714